MFTQSSFVLLCYSLLSVHLNNSCFSSTFCRDASKSREINGRRKWRRSNCPMLHACRKVFSVWTNSRRRLKMIVWTQSVLEFIRISVDVAFDCSSPASFLERALSLTLYNDLNTSCLRRLCFLQSLQNTRTCTALPICCHNHVLYFYCSFCWSLWARL